MVQKFNNHNETFLREIYIELNTDKIITFISENCSAILGFSPCDMLNKSVENFIFQFPRTLEDYMNFRGEILKSDNSNAILDITLSKVLDTMGTIIGYKLSLIDVSKYINVDYKEKQIIQLVERSKDVIYKAELFPEFKFTYISPSINNILGYSTDTFLDDAFLCLDITHPDDKAFMQEKIEGKLDYTLPIPIRFMHKNGSYVWLEDFATPIYNSEGRVVALNGFCRDITQRKLLEEKLELMSIQDGLTGIYNRFYLETHIAKFDEHQDSSVGVFFCDLDNLKITNDTFGHEFGDELIIDTSNILLKVFFRNSLIARVGGDEFVVIIHNTSLDEIENQWFLLQEAIEKQNRIKSKLKINLSVGYAFSETSINTMHQCIRIADQNMYKNKQLKKTRAL